MDPVEWGKRPRWQTGPPKKTTTVRELMEYEPDQWLDMTAPAFNAGQRAINLARVLFVAPKTLDTVCGVWIHGPPGTGKSYFAAEKFPGAFMKSQNKWWDGYNNEKYVIMDDFDTACLGTLMKQWADRYAKKGEVKNGTIQLTYEKFIITSNYTPEVFWPNDDMMKEAINRRFFFINLKDRRPNI